MRILVVSHAAATYAQSKGGADVLAVRHAHLLAREFGEVGFVGILDARDSEGLTYFPVSDADLVAYERFGARVAAFGYLLNHFVRAVKAALVARRVSPTFRPDVIITHTSTATVLLHALRPRTPLVYHIHDGLFVHRTVTGRAERLLRLFMNDILELAAVRRARHVLCVSSSITHQLTSAGVNPGKLSTLPFLLGVPPVEVPAPDGSPVAPPPIVPPGQPFILTVGQQSGRKRFDLLIQAMPHVVSPLRLVVVGDGPLNRHYRDMVRALGLADKVDIEQHVSDSQLVELYRHATGFMLVSENEGFPVTLAEAVSYGCPSILMCPNIESTAEYQGDLTHLVRAMPAPTEIARLMDEAYSDRERHSTRKAAPPLGAGSSTNDGTAKGLRNIYERVFASVLGSNLPASPIGSAR